LHNIANLPYRNIDLLPESYPAEEKDSEEYLEEYAHQKPMFTARHS